jgi:DNA adenine methylase
MSESARCEVGVATAGSRIGPRTAITPFLRWAGSKRKLLPELEAYWNPKYRRYVEPFAGSSCLFFSILPESALLADKNADLVETYEQVRLHPEDVYNGVLELARTERRYYLVRAQDPRRLRPLERAIRFIYLNRNCFNGIYRTNRNGIFNVPFASSRAGRFPERSEFRRAAIALKAAVLRPWDFGTTLRYVREGDFVYLDPPYATSQRRVFREYGKGSFSELDLGRLNDHLRKIVDRGAHFVLSYAECKEARLLAKGWHVRRRRVRRHVAGFIGARRRFSELVISSMQPNKT